MADFSHTSSGNVRITLRNVSRKTLVQPLKTGFCSLKIIIIFLTSNYTVPCSEKLFLLLWCSYVLKGCKPLHTQNYRDLIRLQALTF